jgi:hypothetical protein
MERGVHGHERFRPKVVPGDVSNRAVMPAQACANRNSLSFMAK